MYTKNDGQIQMLGELEIVLFNTETGKIKFRRKHKNLVVTTGRTLIAQRLIANTAAIPSHMAVGTGTTAPAAANTTLVTEISRVLLTALNVTGVTATFSTTFGAGVGTGAITESGIFNAATAGTLLCRTVFPVVNKAAADSLTINWNVAVN